MLRANTVTFSADLCRNHGGSLQTALRMAREACNAGADIVKVQHDDGLDDAGHKRLMDEVHDLKKETAITVRTVRKNWPLEADYIKIGSAECLNEALIKAVKNDGRPWIISTGATTLKEFLWVLNHADRNAIICECVSSYPNEPHEPRLGFLRHQGILGYSDHMPNYHMSLAAIALGATYIEKHLSINPMLPGANHSSSIDPAAFAAMVKQGREIHAALRNTVKEVLPRELSTGKLTEYRARYGR